MEWIYLSPHFDDVALSCGGLAWQQAQAGESVQIWSVCGGAPPPDHPLSPFAQELHARWQTGSEAAAARQAEDRASCQALGAAWQHLPLFDCIYRFDAQGRPYYASEEAIFGHLHPQETGLAAQLAADWHARLPAAAQLVCPLALGSHVDHQLTRLAAERTGRHLWYYPDYPYVLKLPSYAAALARAGWQAHTFPLTAAALAAWQASIAAHASQVSTFWPGLAQMRAAMAAYAAEHGGVKLWRVGNH